jgi:hypothetical protein
LPLAEWLPPVRFISAKGNPAGDASTQPEALPATSLTVHE